MWPKKGARVVVPRFRGSTLFVRMMRMAVVWARDKGAHELSFGVSTEVNVLQTVHAYERLGFTLNAYGLTKDLRVRH